MKRKASIAFSLAVFILAGAVAASMIAAGSEREKEIILTYAEVNSLDGTVAGEMAKAFKEKTEELSNGTVRIDIQAGGVLGTEDQILDNLLGGGNVADISRISALALTQYGCKDASLLAIPYTFVNEDHFWNFAQSDLAQEITRDPYNFDFLTIRPQYDEKELKDALMDNVQRLLMELGSGFAFIGREYRLVVGNTEQFIDLLFYHFQLHCFVVVEVKISEFDPRDMGQLGTYVAAVDGILRQKNDQPTIGLLICKTKDNVLAQYAANVVKAPIGISEYQLSTLLKEEYQDTLPTIEELERELNASESAEAGNDKR